MKIVFLIKISYYICNAEKQQREPVSTTRFI